MRETINGGRTVNQKIEEIIEVHFSYCKLRILRKSGSFLAHKHNFHWLVVSSLVYFEGTTSSMAIRVVEFSSGGKKLERFLNQNQHIEF